MSLIGVFHRYTYIFHGYSGISVVFRYFGDSCDRFKLTLEVLSKNFSRRSDFFIYLKKSEIREMSDDISFADDSHEMSRLYCLKKVK